MPAQVLPGKTPTQNGSERKPPPLLPLRLVGVRITTLPIAPPDVLSDPALAVH
jgi:hypothetical protein